MPDKERVELQMVSTGVKETLRLMKSIESIINEIELNTRKMGAGLQKSGMHRTLRMVKRDMDNLTNSTRRASAVNSNYIRSQGRMISGFEKLRKITMAYWRIRIGLMAVEGAGRAVITPMDDMSRFESQAKLVGASMKDIYRIAQDTRSEMGATVNIVFKMLLANDNLKMSYKEVLKLAKTLNQSFIISGASAMEAAQATRQIGQALSKGKLDGDELRTVLESNAVVSLALSKHLGKSRGELTELGAEGGITAKIFADAMLGASEKIGTDFEGMTMRIDQAFGQLANAWTMRMGTLSKDAGLQQGLVGIIGDLTSAIEGGDLDYLVEGIVDIGRAMVFAVKNAKELSTVFIGLWGAMKAFEIARWVSDISAVSRTLGVAEGKVVKMTAATKLWKGAMVSIIPSAVAIGAAVGAVWYAKYIDGVVESRRKTNEFADSIDGMNERLWKTPEAAEAATKALKKLSEVELAERTNELRKKLEGDLKLIEDAAREAKRWKGKRVKPLIPGLSRQGSVRETFAATIIPGFDSNAYKKLRGRGKELADAFFDGLMDGAGDPKKTAEAFTAFSKAVDAHKVSFSKKGKVFPESLETLISFQQPETGWMDEWLSFGKTLNLHNVAENVAAMSNAMGEVEKRKPVALTLSLRDLTNAYDSVKSSAMGFFNEMHQGNVDKLMAEQAVLTKEAIDQKKEFFKILTEDESWYKYGQKGVDSMIAIAEATVKMRAIIAKVNSDIQRYIKETPSATTSDVAGFASVRMTAAREDILVYQRSITDAERAMGKLKDKTVKTKEKTDDWMQSLQQGTASAMTSFISDMIQGKDATANFGNALANLGSQLVQSQILRLLGGGMMGGMGGMMMGGMGGGMGGGGGGLFGMGGLLGIFHGGGGSDQRSPTDKETFALLKKDETVLTSGQMGAVRSGMGGGAAPSHTSVSVDVRVDPSFAQDYDIKVEQSNQQDAFDNGILMTIRRKRREVGSILGGRQGVTQ